MSSFDLRILACAFMFIDHIGAIFYPELVVLLIIGRWAFPIFAFLVVVGYRHSKSIIRYLVRLLIVGMISQIPYKLAVGSLGGNLNIFFTLGLGLVAIHLYEKNKDLFGLVLAAVIGEALGVDYGAFGVLLVFVFHYYYQDPTLSRKLLFLTLVFVILVGSAGLFDQRLLGGALLFYVVVQPFYLLSLVFIRQYNGSRGKDARWFFYAFYPAHLMILWIIKELH